MWFLISIVLLFFIVWLLIRQPSVQTWLVHKVSDYLSEKLHTKVSVESVNIEFLTSAVINGVYVEDQKKDTLLYAGKITASFGVMQLFSQDFEVKNLSLENVRVRMFRSATDTDFNYQFIADAFASNDTSTSGGKNPTLKLGIIALKNISFTYRDEPAIDVSVRLPAMEASFQNFNLDDPLLDLKKLYLEKPDVVVTQLYDSSAHSSISEPDTGLVHLNRKSFKMLVSEMKMSDARFRYEVENTKQDSGIFDQHHMDFTGISMDIRDGKFIADTITAFIKNISAKEKSGLVVNSLSANARITPTQSSLENLLVKLPRSEVKNSFSFQYLSFRDFQDFIPNVFMQADFKKSYVCPNDLSCFSPELKAMIDPIELNGKLSGTVDNLKLKELLLKAGTETMAKGKIIIQGLPSINDMYFEVQLEEATTSANDLRIIYPDAQLPNEVSKAGLISLKGNMSGFLNDFVTNMVLVSNLGVATTDLNMKLNENRIPEYSGSLQTSNFELGHLFGLDSSLGKVSLTTAIKGKGFELSILNSNINSKIDKIEFLGYPYHDITVNGSIEEKVFNGKLRVNDHNLQFNFSGEINLQDSIPVYDFIAKVERANLDSLGFISRHLSFSSDLNIKLKGNNPLTGTGTIAAENTLFDDGEDSFLVRHLNFDVTEISSNRKTLQLRTDFLNADFNGNFVLPEVPLALLNTVKYYLPSLNVMQGDSISPQRFDYDIEAKNMMNFNSFFLKGIEGLSNTRIMGHYASDSNYIFLEGKIPYLKYGETFSNDLQLNGESNNGALSLSLTSNFFQINDSFKVVDPFVSATVAENKVLFNVKANDENGNYKIDLLASANGEGNNIRIRFLPSAIQLNHQQWNFAPGNNILIGEKSLHFDNLSLAHESQSIRFENATDSESVKVSLSKIRIEDFYNLFRLSKYEVRGELNGTASIFNLYQSPRYEANIAATQFAFNGDSADKVIVKIDYNTNKDLMTLSAKVKDDLYDVEASGSYLPNSTSNSLDMKAEIIKVELPILGKYLSDYVSNVSGRVGGQLFLKGTLSKPSVTGSLSILNAEAKVDYLQTSYSFSGATIKLDDNKIDLGEITLYDDVKNGRNPAIVTGIITHDHLSDFAMDLHMSTKNFHMLNTSPLDNSLFYGSAFGGGTIDLTGPVDALVMNSRLKTNEGTDISIPISDDASLSGNSFVYFVKHNTDTKSTADIPKTMSNIKMNFDLSMNELAKVNIIFDEKAGDIISGTGNGDMRLEIDLGGDFNMFGNYVIEKGDYLFTLQNFINKPFSIERGGSISWNGDPYDAQVDINAIYSQSKVSLTDLVTDVASLPDADRREVEKKIPIDVYMHLTGSLLTPNISFDIKEGNDEGINSFASRKLNEIRNDENELNKQVFGLLMIHRFIPPNAGGAGLVSSGVNTSVSEFFANQLSYWVSQNSLGIGLNVSGDIPGLTGNNTDPNSIERRKEMQIILTKAIFHNRIILEAGGNVDFNNTTSDKSTNAYLSDFTIEYKITPDGRFSAKAFNRSQYDVIEERNRDTYGVSLSFKKDFNNLHELFTSQREKKVRKVKN